MADDGAKTLVCLASFEKGHEFLHEAKRLGWRVILLTVTGLEHADWPREILDDIFFMPDLSRVEDVTHGVAYLARTNDIRRIVALDDYDVLTCAALREHMRLPGMGQSASRLMRDKLAMRVRAAEREVPVPEFVPVFNHEAIRTYLDRVPGPWLLKPRAEASTIGIARVNAPDELWPRLDALGDRQSYFLLERYIPGEVCHVDSLSRDGEVIFAEVHQYGRPPLDVFHEGGLAVTRTLTRESEDARSLLALNRRVLEALEFHHGAAHVEFIRAHEDGRLYFLESGARVGGAHIVDLIVAATGLNMWREWARIELASPEQPYTIPDLRRDHAGLIVTLARQELPDLTAYADPEIVWRMEKHHHAGLIVAAPDAGRVEYLLNEYGRRFTQDFHASLPPLTDAAQIRQSHGTPPLADDASGQE